MKVKHVFGGHMYLISNFGVARNPLYRNDEDLSNFRDLIEKYLSEICEIHAYSHQFNQFQYLIKIKERSYLEEFYFKKQAKNKKAKENVSPALYDLSAELAPESYLIFSQEVSNCLNAYAKKFNHKYERKGGLFGDRYQKILIESEEEFEEWKTRLNGCEELVFFEQDWKVEEGESAYEFENGGGECSSKVWYIERVMGEVKCFFTNFIAVSRQDLRGCFDCLPPASIKSLDFANKFALFKKIRGIPPPW